MISKTLIMSIQIFCDVIVPGLEVIAIVMRAMYEKGGFGQLRNPFINSRIRLNEFWLLFS